MLYVEPVYRPPSEAGSLLVQASVGCSSGAQGHCHYCGSWLLERTLAQKKFRIRPIREIIEDLEEAHRTVGRGVRRIFFLDSNAMIMGAASLEQITGKAYALFPHLERVSVYACASDILKKSDEDLKRIRRSGLSLLYIGMESGSEEVLKLQNKGVTLEETALACSRAMEAGFELSLTVIIGLGGKKLSRVHAIDTGKALSRIQPHYVGALTLMVVPGTPIEEWISQGSFELLSQEEIINELKLILENLEVEKEVVFRTNHASNYLPLRGTLPRDKDRMLDLIREAQGHRVPLRPEHLRGL